MMINKSILENKLQEKFNNLTLHAIINEAFLGGLVFGKDELSKKDAIELSKYSYKVLESIGGFKSLESALEQETELDRLVLLSKIYDICTESSSSMVKYHLKAQEADTDNKNLQEIVDKAKFTNEEYTKFIKNAKIIDIDYVSKIIKEKVIKVINEERDEYEKNEQLEKELIDTIKDDTIEDDTKTLENYLNIVLDKSFVREPISLFSKLQDIAIENLMHSDITKLLESNIEIPMDTIDNITFENSLDTLSKNTIKDPIKALENACVCFNNEKTDLEKTKISELSTISSIIIYTALETLNTFNLYTPSKNEIVKVLECENSYDNNMNLNMDKIHNVIMDKLMDIQYKYLDNECTDSKEMIETNSELRKYYEILDKFKENENYSAIVQSLCDKITNIIKLIEIKVKKLSEIKVVPTELTSFEKREKEMFILELNKIARQLTAKPNIKEIKININPETEHPVFLNLELKEPNGVRVSQTNIPVKHRPAFGSFIEYIKESVSTSKLSSNDNLSIYIYDINTGNRTHL